MYMYYCIFLGETFLTTIRSRCCLPQSECLMTKLCIISTKSNTAVGPNGVTKHEGLTVLFLVYQHK